MKLNNDIAKIVSNPVVKEKLAAQGFDFAPTSPPSAFSQQIRDDLAKWVPIVKASGAKVDCCRRTSAPSINLDVQTR